MVPSGEAQNLVSVNSEHFRKSQFRLPPTGLIAEGSAGGFYIFQGVFHWPVGNRYLSLISKFDTEFSWRAWLLQVMEV